MRFNGDSGALFVHARPDGLELTFMTRGGIVVDRHRIAATSDGTMAAAGESLARPPVVRR